MKVSRDLKKKIALTWLEADSEISDEVVEALKKYPEIIWVRIINV
jgi:hypothetical protein